MPYQLILKTHMPLQDAYNNIFLNYYQHSYYNFDNNEIHIPLAAGIMMYSSYYFFTASDRAFKDYVVKLQYSKDKELLFVTRVSPYGAQVHFSTSGRRGLRDGPPGSPAPQREVRSALSQRSGRRRLVGRLLS